MIQQSHFWGIYPGSWRGIEVKWSEILCHVWIFVTPMDYRVHGILQVRILEWVNIPFSRGSSQSRDETQVSHIAGRFFTSWATRKAWRGISTLIVGLFTIAKLLKQLKCPSID